MDRIAPFQLLKKSWLSIHLLSTLTTRHLGAVLVVETVPLLRRVPPLILQLFVGVSLKELRIHLDLFLIRSLFMIRSIT